MISRRLRRDVRKFGQGTSHPKVGPNPNQEDTPSKDNKDNNHHQVYQGDILKAVSMNIEKKRKQQKQNKKQKRNENPLTVRHPCAGDPRCGYSRAQLEKRVIIRREGITIA